MVVKTSLGLESHCDVSGDSPAQADLQHLFDIDIAANICLLDSRQSSEGHHMQLPNAVFVLG